MSRQDRSTARSFPGSCADVSAESISGPAHPRATFSHPRRSLAGRMSQSIATRLSVVGLRAPPRTGTVAGVTINTLCNVMGAGVLALPLATRNASIALALVLLAYVGLMSAYAVYCLVVACDATGRYSVTEMTAFALFPPRPFDVFCAATVADSGDGAAQPHSASMTTSQFRGLRLQHARDELRRRRWRRATTVLVESIVFCANAGSLIIYARVIADSMPPVVGNVCAQLGLPAYAVLLHETFWLVVSGVVFFVLSCARNMEELKLSSLLGFLTILYIVVVVAYRFLTASWSADPEENARGFPAIDPEARGEIVWFTVRPTALRTISAYGVAYGYHFNVPYFYAELGRRTPTEMMKTVAVAFPVIIASYAVTGVLGYLTFGELVGSAQAGGNIVSNYPDNDVLVNIGRLGLFAHFACVFPIVSVCARRGLHRLAMTALTWPVQSALMRLEVDQLVEEEKAAERQQQHPSAGSQTIPTGSSSDAHGTLSTPLMDHGERTPLLPGSAAAAAAAAATAALGPGGAGHGGGLGTVAPLDPADLDRDVGAPADTTRLAIVLEALILVSTCVVLAGAVSGIGFVIDVMGALFGVFLILIVPGVVGTRVFSADFTWSQAMGEAAEEAGGATIAVDPFHFAPSAGGWAEGGVRYARVKYWLCVLSAVSGVVFTAVATAVLISDHLPNRAS